MSKLRSKLSYYLLASYRRKLLDKLLEENKHYYKGVVLDIGGRDRGKFKKPKDKVEKWIFADIEAKHNPDIILDVSEMDKIETESIDVVSAIELFEHVEKINEGIKECYRILKKNGVMILSVPFLYPIHSDPHDFQRWTEDKWKKEITEIDFTIEKFIVMGRYFTVMADMKIIFMESLPKPLKYFCYIFYPLLDLMAKLDNLSLVKNHSKLGKFHEGYFIVLKK